MQRNPAALEAHRAAGQVQAIGAQDALGAFGILRVREGLAGCIQAGFERVGLGP